MNTILQKLLSYNYCIHNSFYNSTRGTPEELTTSIYAHVAISYSYHNGGIIICPMDGMESLLTAAMNGWLYLNYCDYQLPGLEQLS